MDWQIVSLWLLVLCAVPDVLSASVQYLGSAATALLVALGTMAVLVSLDPWNLQGLHGLALFGMRVRHLLCSYKALNKAWKWRSCTQAALQQDSKA